MSRHNKKKNFNMLKVINFLCVLTFFLLSTGSHLFILCIFMFLYHHPNMSSSPNIGRTLKLYISVPSDDVVFHHFGKVLVHTIQQWPRGIFSRTVHSDLCLLRHTFPRWWLCEVKNLEVEPIALYLNCWTW